MYRPSPLAATLVIPSVCPTRTPDGFCEEPNDRRSLHILSVDLINGRRRTHHILINESSEALTRIFPDEVSAQQQLFTSSLCAAIFTVLRSARRSYTKIFPLPPATTSLPSAEKRQLQIPNASSSEPHTERVRLGGSAKRIGICAGEPSRVLAMYTVGVMEEYIMRWLSGLRCESVIVHRPGLP